MSKISTAVGLEAKYETFRDKGRNALLAFSDSRHLEETVTWIERARRAGGDGGVARAYRAASLWGQGGKGWQPSYPETTGYIIPTMFALSDYFNLNDHRNHAIAMADWEIDIQLPSGAVMGSVVTAPPSPAVFNTGQVIFGWLAAHRQTGKSAYLGASTKAGDYLLSVQEGDGSWHKGDSKYARKGATTYNTRVAWSLIELGLETSENKYINSGTKNIEFASTRQLQNGWFLENCLTDPERPLLHTIAYAARGILESGIALNEARYIKAGLKTLDSLLVCQRHDGGIPGRLSSDWSSQADWDCLTGDAQVSVAWLRAYAITGNEKYKDAAKKAIEFIKRSQNLEHPNPGIRGGVKGSFPFDGPYGKYEMLNWAAKFFCDALMMANDEDLAKKGIKG